jgi:hypothetical protein
MKRVTAILHHMASHPANGPRSVAMRADAGRGKAMKPATAIALAIALAGCAAHVNVAKVPGCSTGVVTVPNGCYSIVFNGALEVRCDNGNTTRYICTRSEGNP